MALQAPEAVLFILYTLRYSARAFNTSTTMLTTNTFSLRWSLDSSVRFPFYSSSFLALGEAGLVKGIPKGNYTKSIKNKEYAARTVEILKQNKLRTYTPKELWLALELGNKRSNSQMDVVLALWNANLIS